MSRAITVYSVTLVIEALEGRLLLDSVECLPGLVGPSDLPKYTAGQVVYLDFDGAEDVTYHGPITIEDLDILAFSLAGTSLAGGGARRAK